ncbi:hypothetical protein CoNPh11_CDS0069 [Staphylococcus phage S-CoN_Ph11]|nr:hypothetical protein CoNPh11_CDS0069 [Staphylococcus phage S-CoN_Ph11]
MLLFNKQVTSEFNYFKLIRYMRTLLQSFYQFLFIQLKTSSLSGCY